MREYTSSETAPILVPGALPDFGLVHPVAHEQRKQCRQSTNEEHWSPAPARENEEVADCGEEISRRISLLQKPGEHPALAGRRLLHGQRSTNSPLAAHPDSE